MVMPVKLSAIKPNDKNPRTIRDARFERLKTSLEEFPAMMELRPIITDAEGTILGGNMRYRALKALGYKELPDGWVKRADELTEEEKRRFIIADNVGFGDWDWDTLGNEWDSEELAAWGLEVPGWDAGGPGVDYSDKNQEIDVDEFGDTMTISLKYSEDEYWKVKEQLSKIAQTPEAAVWKLLGNEA
jgi:hypothetical protein